QPSDNYFYCFSWIRYDDSQRLDTLHRSQTSRVPVVRAVASRLDYKRLTDVTVNNEVTLTVSLYAVVQLWVMIGYLSKTYPSICHLNAVIPNYLGTDKTTIPSPG